MSATPAKPQGPASAYLRTRVLTASPEELRLMLLEGAIKFARQGREGLESRNYESTFTGISRCRDIVLELLTTIAPDVEATLSERVRAVYTFMYSRLVEASMERSLPKLDEVIRLLEFERETWVMLMQKLARERAEPGAPSRPAALSLEG
jgi:flagellar secretion chaperone FliS